MIELLIAACIFAVLALMLFYRLAFGPTLADRAIVADAIDMLVSAALVCYSLYSGRAIYLDIALVLALLGFLGTLLISKYLEGSL